MQDALFHDFLQIIPGEFAVCSPKEISPLMHRMRSFSPCGFPEL